VTKWLHELPAIIGLLVAVAIVLSRLPRVELGHSAGFRRRRMWNWLPLGLTYAFLYMARYNLDVAKNAGLMDKADLGTVSAIGMWVYGVSFLLNGPLTDRLGGRKTILIAAAGAALTNILMGVVVVATWSGHSYLANAVPIFGLLYGANMYFQSFGAVSIVKVNASWFHLRERGTFGGIFGILIALGLYFAYDWNKLIVDSMPLEWVFFVPALLLIAFLFIDTFLVFDRPSDTGHKDFEVGDASHADDETMTVLQVFKRMFSHPVIMTIAVVELMTGFVRGAVMKWTYIFLPETGHAGSYIYKHWGMTICIAGILGGVVAGTVSDRLFHSRRGPSAAMLYALTAAVLGLTVTLIHDASAAVLFACAMMSLIGIHGMLSGTASMDFGGTRNVGVAVGIIDGMVYLGNGAQSLLYGQLLPEKSKPGAVGGPAADADNWLSLPIICAVVAAVAFVVCLRLWNAKATRATAH
jgi:OPA family glycerol-3-phosphate transporter-like MFS transporter